MDPRAVARLWYENIAGPSDRPSQQSARESLPAWRAQWHDPAVSRGQYAPGMPDSFQDSDVTRTDPLANRDTQSHANWPRRPVSAGHSKSTPSASPYIHETPAVVLANRAAHETWSPSGSGSGGRAETP